MSLPKVRLGEYLKMIRTKMSVAIGALCLIAVICVGLLVYMTERAHRVQDHLDLQYRGLIGFIELDSTIYETFMAARHTFFEFGEHRAFDPNTAKRDIETKLMTLENTILAKAEFLHWTQSQVESEKKVIADLRDEVAISFAELELAMNDPRGRRSEFAIERASYVFDVRIERMFEDMITTKITSERDRMQRAQRDIRSFSHLSTSLTIILAVCLIGITLWAIFTLLWQVQHGLDVLARGTQRLASGDLHHRIELNQQDELGQLARFFNHMASRFKTGQEALRTARNDLEQKVDLRTEELNKANSELKERDELRRQFFADIGHELRTPVTAIRGQAEVALRSKDHHLEHRSEALKKIVSLTDQLTQDVGALFFIAREQAGVIDLRRDAVDLGGVASRVISNMSAYFEKERATVRLVSSQGVEYLVDGTESRLSQLLSILLTNAIVHSHSGVSVTVTLSINKNRVLLVVSDNGPGIPSAERKRVFDRFYRMDNHLEGGVTGTGLGLPIARSLTHAHGGMIRVDESDEGGTEIYVSFPRSQDVDEVSYS